jgi:hypothetical protein
VGTTNAASSVVAICQGHRCAALLASWQPEAMGRLRRAAQRSRLGVLVTTDCLGRCADGPVATVGTGHQVDGALRMTPSAVLGPVDAGAVQQLAAHLGTPAGPADAPAGQEARR